MAVKTMKEVTKENLDRFREEILLTGDLRHANVVTMVGACWEADLMALVMEYCDKGMSSELLRSEGAHFSWDDPLLKWLMDVSKAMCYLHSVTYYDVRTATKVEGIVHRDLKPDNCLVSETYSIKVADFGEARAVLENNTMTQVGTPLYIAPEIVKGDHYGKAADVFSFAMTALHFSLRGQVDLGRKLHDWLLSCGRYSKKQETLSYSVGRIGHNIISKDWRPRMEQMTETGGPEIPSTIAGLIDLCWIPNPADRPTYPEVLEYLETSAKMEISGMQGTASPGGEGRVRRTSTSGGLAMRMKANQEAHKEKEAAITKAAGDLEDRVKVLERENEELRARLR